MRGASAARSCAASRLSAGGRRFLRADSARRSDAASFRLSRRTLRKAHSLRSRNDGDGRSARRVPCRSPRRLVRRVPAGGLVGSRRACARAFAVSLRRPEPRPLCAAPSLVVRASPGRPASSGLLMPSRRRLVPCGRVVLPRVASARFAAAARPSGLALSRSASRRKRRREREFFALQAFVTRPERCSRRARPERFCPCLWPRRTAAQEW